VTRDEIASAVRAWLETAWDPERPLVEWRRLLVDAGWAAPSWPADRHGRGLPAWADEVVADELRNAGAVGTPVGVAMWLAAPTLLAHGDADLLDRLLRPILTGETSWCQLFSEPGAGSDLAGLTTTAVRDGDEWIVNGQKVWTTSAHHADMAMLLARTDWGVPKHKGLTYFALPMHQASIEVRPLKQMTGHASLNEVFFTDARVPDANVVGAVGDGWRVALTTLAHERRFGAVLAGTSAPAPSGRAAREAAAETAEHTKTYRWYPQRAGRPDLLAERCVGAGAGAIERDEVARVLSRARASQWTAARAQAARALGRAPGAEGSLGKLAASHVAREASRAHSLIAGATGMLAGTDPAGDPIVAEVLVSVPAQSIAGGTDEIQRNIIGEKVLGLPREPSSDRDIPFRDVPRNAGR
jgi:alkylation response protein AidB-like acyl-CoA dehydrogenase